MTPAARLTATLELLTALETDPRPADAVTSAWVRSRRDLGEEERGAVIEAAQAVQRHRARLGWHVAQAGEADGPRARLIAWAVVGEGAPADQIARIFGGDLAHRLTGRSLTPTEMPEEVRLECPDWAVAPLRRRFGGSFAEELAAMLAPPPLDLRVNLLKASRAAVLAELRRLGLPAKPTRLAPHGIRVHERLSLSRLAGLKTGEIEIQDEGSQLIAELVDARPGERVADVCAGAGGKTLAIAAQMGNRGQIIACDVNEARLKRAAERLRRAGVHNAQTRVIAGEADRWIKRQKGGFDRVLIDAPCSGTGTWRRNPDARWRAPEEAGLDALIDLQGRILTSAARLVKPGGRLVYATCSLLIEENEDQVARFLARHPEFALMPVREATPRLGSGDMLSLTPARHGTDGFFAAVLRRADAAP